MDEQRLAHSLAPLLGTALAIDITTDFLKLRRDVATETLERATAGKFVESFVQCLRTISNRLHDDSTKIDTYLNRQVESDTSLPDGLRICGSRIARSIYTMRNKRNIAHKGKIDPNTTDLEFTYHAAAWIMAELVRCAKGITMEEAGTLIKLIREPVGTLVEEIDGDTMVHAKVPLRSEILILLHSKHPDLVAHTRLVKWVGKTASATRARLSELKKNRLIVGDSNKGYKLTSAGFKAAVDQICRLQS